MKPQEFGLSIVAQALGTVIGGVLLVFALKVGGFLGSVDWAGVGKTAAVLAPLVAGGFAAAIVFRTTPPDPASYQARKNADGELVVYPFGSDQRIGQLVQDESGEYSIIRDAGDGES